MKIILYKKNMPLEWGPAPVMPEPEEQRIKRIVRAVARQGDRAVIRYTKKFDQYPLTARTMRITPRKIAAAAAQAPAPYVRALRQAIRNIRKYHQCQRLQSWQKPMGTGIWLGQRVQPIERVGVYVPGGENAYPSSLLMNVIPAQVAGVPEIVVATPPQRLLENPLVCAALQELGITQAFGVGGIQAIAALAFGTETIPAVDKIVGPGNQYVQAAKRAVFGMVGTDIFAGPSEVVVIADTSASPVYIAADLIAQAEHTGDNPAICITTSNQLASSVLQELVMQIKAAPRRQVIRRSLNAWGRIIIVKSLAEAIELSNRIAPEHLQIMTRNPRGVLKNIRNAGSIFLGAYAPVPLGDFFAGPNHVLPTGQTARFFSPLNVTDFIKRSSVTQYSRQALARTGRMVMELATAEGLAGHRNAIAVRLSRKKKPM